MGRFISADADRPSRRTRERRRQSDIAFLARVRTADADGLDRTNASKPGARTPSANHMRATDEPPHRTRIGATKYTSEAPPSNGEPREGA